MVQADMKGRAPSVWLLVRLSSKRGMVYLCLQVKPRGATHCAQKKELSLSSSQKPKVRCALILSGSRLAQDLYLVNVTLVGVF